MIKCQRCGKVYEDDNIEVCEVCGYNFAEGKKLAKVLDTKPDPDVDETKQTDLFDFPILGFVLGLLGLILPIFIFSILAIKLSKKPAKTSLVPFSKLAYIMGIIGLFVSVAFIFMLIFLIF